MKRILGGLLAGGLLVSGASVTGVPAASAADGTTPTRFAFSAAGYGTRLVGGEVPASSRTTAFQNLGCTNKAGRTKENHLVSTKLPGLGTVSEAKTTITTSERKGVTSTRTISRIERIVLGQEGVGSVAIEAIKANTRAWHDGDSFHAQSRTSVGSIVFTDPTGKEQQLDLPTPDQPITIPGLVSIQLGRNVEKAGATSARAAGEALRISVLPTGTKLKVAHADAELAKGIVSGLFGGNTAAIRTSALQDNASVGPQPLLNMYCQGTRGKVIKDALAGVDLDDGVVVDGLSSRMRADQDKSGAWGTMAGKVAGVDIGGGRVVVEAITGRANVERDGATIKRNAKGTTIGSITIDGEEQSFPKSDVIEVPGLVRLERDIIEKSANGISVIALKITLLDGDGAVVKLGQAKMTIRRPAR